jgi:hypothetical protein
MSFPSSSSSAIQNRVRRTGKGTCSRSPQEEPAYLSRGYTHWIPEQVRNAGENACSTARSLRLYLLGAVPLPACLGLGSDAAVLISAGTQYMYRVTSFPVHAQSKDATTAAGFHHACSLFLGCRDGDGLLESAFHAVAALVTAAIGIGLAVESIPSDVDLTNVPVSRHLVSQVVHLALLG